jgi:hypothetical protein
MHIFKFIFIGLFKKLELATLFIFVLGYVILTNARVKVSVVEYSLTSESRIL